jgi:NADPH:quinone reductase
VLLKSCSLVGVAWGAWATRDPAGHRAVMQELFDLYRQGKVKPHVTARFPLARGAEAIAHVAGRHALGKVVVTMD